MARARFYSFTAVSPGPRVTSTQLVIYLLYTRLSTLNSGYVVVYHTRCLQYYRKSEPILLLSLVLARLVPTFLVLAACCVAVMVSTDSSSADLPVLLPQGPIALLTEPCCVFNDSQARALATLTRLPNVWPHAPCHVNPVRQPLRVLVSKLKNRKVRVSSFKWWSVSLHHCMRT